MIIKYFNEGRELTFGSDGASCIDLRVNTSVERILDIGKRWKIPTGLYLEIPEGFEGQVRGRSGLMIHHGLMVPIGTIDSDYRGEIFVIAINMGEHPFIIRPGERVAQLAIAPIARPEYRAVSKSCELEMTDRGRSGFGSTGV